MKQNKNSYFAVALVIIGAFFIFVNSAWADLESGLVAYYKFNGNTFDYSGNNNHATNNGAVTATDQFGNSDRAYSFDRTNDYMQAPDASSLDVGSG